MKIIEILADGSYLQALQSVAERHEAADYWVGLKEKTAVMKFVFW